MEQLDIWKNQKKLLHLTNQNIADIAKLPLRTVEQIMCGKVKNPRLDTVQAIERALGLNKQKPTPTLTDEEKELFHLISQLTDEEVEELSRFVDFIISKRK